MALIVLTDTSHFLFVVPQRMSLADESAPSDCMASSNFSTGSIRPWRCVPRRSRTDSDPPLSTCDPCKPPRPEALREARRRRAGESMALSAAYDRRRISDIHGGIVQMRGAAIGAALGANKTFIVLIPGSLASRFIWILRTSYLPRTVGHQPKTNDVAPRRVGIVDARGYICSDEKCRTTAPEPGPLATATGVGV